MQKSAARFLLPKTHEEVWYRGEKYVEERKVQAIKGDEKEVEAQVLGTSLYLVKLKFTGGGLSKGCDCPYAKDSLARHPACKHIVATAIVWDEMRNIPRPTKEEIGSHTIAPPAISRREIDQMYRSPLHADLEKLRILADETALGRKPRPHTRLPAMPKVITDYLQPLIIGEIKGVLQKSKNGPATVCTTPTFVRVKWRPPFAR